MTKRFLGFLSFIFLSVLVVPVSAQGVATLAYGSSTIGALTAEAPLNLYVFNGNIGDIVTAEVIALDANTTPTLSLLAPNQQVLAGGGLDQLNSSGGAATVTRVLPAAGTYSLLVGGTPGQYIVRLKGLPAPTSMAPLTIPGSVDITLSADLKEQAVSVSNGVTGPVALSIAGGSAVAPVTLAAYNADGQPVARLSAVVDSACLTIPANSGNLLLILTGANNGQPLGVTVSATEGSCGSQSGPAPTAIQQPAATPVQIQQPNDPSAACTVASATAVNVRSGPGTQYGVLTQLQPGVPVPVVGASDSGWIVVNINNVQGFVSLTVVSTFGNCANLPYIPAPAGGQQQPVAPTATQAQQQPPTATQEQQQQPTQDPGQQQQQPTATTPPPTDPPPTDPPPTATEAANIAAPDTNYALQVPLDGNASVTDFVSYPDGDTEDMVSYAVNGLNPSVALPGGQADLTLTFSCFGNGTQHISFIVDGQTRSCGQSYTRRVNADSRTGAVRIRATGGEGTYVQWVVQATAPRVN